jgi:CRISPR-associated endonuclease/helicase Cas3
MVQRFGRVNRRAEPGEARIAVIPVADEKEAEDEVKAERLAVLKAPFLSADWPGAPAPVAGSPPPPVAELWPKDASPGTLAELKAGPLKPLINAAITEAPLRPPLIRATLDAWSLTSLEEHPGRPKVEPWLRGWIDKEPQTTVLWRRIFPLRAGEDGVTDELRAFFEAASPHMSETLEAPTWRVAEILRERAKRMTKGSPESDTEIADPDDGSVLQDQEESEAEKAGQQALPGERSPNHRPVVVIMKQDGTIERVALIETFRNQDTKRLAAALAGRTVVIDARTGGLDANGLLDPKADDVPLTSDMANREAWGPTLLHASGRRVSFGEKPAGDQSAKGAWRLEPFRWAVSDGDESAGIWIEVWRGVDGERPGDPAVSRRAQALDEHHAQAEKHARRIATALNIPAPQRTMLAAVAAIHDRGKDRKLWQDAMGARREGRPYAKTMGGGNSRALNGYRHEFGTLRELAAGKIALPEEVEGDEALRDLALHLIAAHHGHARPIIVPLDPDPDGPPPSELAPLAREAALRFARLQRLWGPWGLAWWETLLRAADWAASRANDEQEVGDD